MALPSSRNTTYSAASPIKSADLNALQDCIIGAKHPALTFPYPAQAFVLRGAAGPALGDGFWASAVASELVAPLRLPVGSRLVSLTYTVSTDNAGGNVQFIVRRRPKLGGPNADVDNSNLSSIAIANKTQVVNHTILASNWYWLIVAFNGAFNHVFEGVDIVADRL